MIFITARTGLWIAMTNPIFRRICLSFCGTLFLCFAIYFLVKYLSLKKLAANNKHIAGKLIDYDKKLIKNKFTEISIEIDVPVFEYIGNGIVKKYTSKDNLSKRRQPGTAVELVVTEKGDIFENSYVMINFKNFWAFIAIAAAFYLLCIF